MRIGDLAPSADKGYRAAGMKTSSQQDLMLAFSPEAEENAQRPLLLTKLSLNAEKNWPSTALNRRGH